MKPISVPGEVIILASVLILYVGYIIGRLDELRIQRKIKKIEDKAVVKKMDKRD